MIRRVYCDNFKCFANFDLRLREVSLLAGLNGSGKTTVFEVLLALRRFLGGEHRVLGLFPASTLTRWDPRRVQAFELELASEDGVYLYRLKIEHDEARKKARVDLESLDLDGKPLFHFHEGKVQLYRDDHSEGPSYPFDWTQSGLAALVPSEDNRNLIWFREQIRKLLIVSMKPDRMDRDSAGEEAMLSPGGVNFASWYRYLLQEYQTPLFELPERLRDVLPGFQGFRLVQAGSENRELRAGFAGEEDSPNPTYYRFDELSDGQRVLMVLYTMLLIAPHAGYRLFLDEPENFLALPELQPWLMELRDASIPQAVLISHHPELLDYLGPDCGIWLERDAEGPARASDLPRAAGDSLKLSEAIARGWV